MSTSDRGFASMDDAKQREIASKGGQSKTHKNSASEAGKKGAAAQPTEAKAKGGKNSHRSS